jgi:prepilin-type N-terminal cleavage/methylation domain-containing protein
MRHGHRTKDAFTLVEMIVVILIIATLTALFVGAAANTFDRARRAQAKNDVTQIVTAVNAFYTEYGRYPVTVTDPTKDAFFGAGATPAGSTSYSNNDVLFNVLRNITTDPNAVALNPRQIVFLSPGGQKTLFRREVASRPTIAFTTPGALSMPSLSIRTTTTR